MAIIVRPADLHADREVVVQLLLRCVTEQSSSARFDWLYSTSPYGSAQAWLAVDEESDTVVGAAAAFPRRFYVGDSEVSAWVLGDFCLDLKYRSLGPALRLQGACLGVTESNGGMFCYDFPSASMLAVYKRLGFSVTGKMLRLAKLLRVDRKVREIVNVRLAQRAVTAVGNTLLKLAPAKVRADESLEIALHQGPCGEEFSALAREQRGRLGICIQRSAGYLNWRYVNNPIARYEIVTARRGSDLKDYAVWTQTGEDAWVVDLFGDNDPAVVRRLLVEIAALLTKRGVMTLSVSINESHPWLSVFSGMGFRLRESSPVVIIPSKTFAGKIPPQLTGWYLMQGDRDS